MKHEYWGANLHQERELPNREEHTFKLVSDIQPACASPDNWRANGPNCVLDMDDRLPCLWLYDQHSKKWLNLKGGQLKSITFALLLRLYRTRKISSIRPPDVDNTAIIQLLNECPDIFVKSCVFWARIRDDNNRLTPYLFWRYNCICQRFVYPCSTRNNQTGLQ